MNCPLISVIVPVYKTEAYLERCVNSIRNQTYTNLEIILVDDGSPDRCGEMCDQFAQEDSRIRVFHKENGGQSAARNLALDHMTGEYVGFVDSDDWLELGMYQQLYTLAVEKKAQIVCCGIQMDYLNGRMAYFNTNYPQDKEIREYSRLDALRESLDNSRITYSPCDKLYHKSVFSDLRMTIGRIYEDMEIIPKCIEQAQRIVYDPYPFYHYNQTEESTIRGEFNLNRFSEADVAWEKAEDYRVRYPQLYKQAMVCYVSICLRIIHLSYGVSSCVDRRDSMINFLRRELPRDIRKELGKKDKIKLAILYTNPTLYECMMWLYDKTK